MRTRYGTTLVLKMLFLLAALLLSGLAFSGCSPGRNAVPRGWSGGATANGTLFIGSMEGKLVAVDVADGSLLGEVLLETPEAAGGGLSCAPPSAAVAIYGSPAVSGDLVYVAGYNGKVYAFSFENNRLRKEPRWIYPRQGNLDHIVGGLIVAQGKVYFGDGSGKVYALDAADGFQEWEQPFETGDKIWSTPAVDGDTLFVGSFDNKLYALDTTDGSKKWEFKTEGAITSVPAVNDDTVFIGSFDRYLYAVNAADGTLRWKFMAGNWFWVKPVIANGTVYAANLDGKVYALAADSGNKLVEFDLGSPVSSAPVLVGDSVVVASQAGVVYALDSDSNQQRLLVNLEEKVYASLSASEGIVYVHTDKDTLHAIDARSGARREFSIK